MAEEDKKADRRKERIKAEQVRKALLLTQTKALSAKLKQQLEKSKEAYLKDDILKPESEGEFADKILDTVGAELKAAKEERIANAQAKKKAQIREMKRFSHALENKIPKEEDVNQEEEPKVEGEEEVGPDQPAVAQREKSQDQNQRYKLFGEKLQKESAKKEQSVSTIQASGGEYNEEKFLEYLMGVKREIKKIGNTDSHEGEGRLFKGSEEEPQILSSFKIVGESGQPITDQFSAGAPESPATSSEKNKKIVSYEMVLHNETEAEPEKKVTYWVQGKDAHNPGDIDITHTDEDALQKAMVLIKALGSFSTVDVRELDNKKFEVGLSAATRAWVAAKYHEFKTIPDTIDAFSSLTDAQKRAATNLLEKLRNPIPDPSSIVRLRQG